MIALLAAALIAIPPPDVVARARLHSGRVLVESTQQGELKGTSRALAWARCPPAAVWSVITDHARFPEFMPHLKSAEVSQRSEKGERVLQVVDAVFSTARYTLDFAFDKEALRVEYALVPALAHDIADARGHWQLWAFEGGTLIEYQSPVDVGRPVPGFIRSYLAERGAEDGADAVRTRAEKSR